MLQLLPCFALPGVRAFVAFGVLCWMCSGGLGLGSALLILQLKVEKVWAGNGARRVGCE